MRGARLALPLAIALVAVTAGPALAVVDVSGPARGIAVAPFANSRGVASAREAGWPDVASMLAQQLGSLSGERVVTPDALLHDARGIDDPQARDVRRWAQWNGVQNVVIGRVDRADRRQLDVAVELRSGHSGGPRASYRLEPADRDDVDGAVTRLAQLILADAGDPAATPTDAGGDASGLPGVSAPATDEPPAPGSAPTAPEDEDDGIALVPGVARDEPISINSDELEVLPQDGGRRLVFSHNVEVQQGGITLHADRLEAVYPQGASQPDRLQASGNVRVAQGNRRGRCEEATYERSSRTIVCRGRAEVMQGCDQVRGEEIEFDLANERVRVLGAASVVIQPEHADAAGCVAEGEGTP